MNAVSALLTYMYTVDICYNEYKQIQHQQTETNTEVDIMAHYHGHI